MENVLIYGSIFDFTDVLTDEQTGKLFKAINKWRKDEEVTFDDLLLKGIWMGIEPNLDKLKNNYETKANSNRENGKKGGRPKKETPSTKVEAPKEAPKQVLIENDTVVSEEVNEVIKTRVIEDDVDTTFQLNNGVIVSIKKEYEEVYNNIFNDKPKTFKELKNSTGQGDFEYTLKRSYESYKQMKELENL